MLIANIRQPPSVAIIGGGVSGLVAGAALTAVGINATVFDTGENACGGRLSTRVVGAPGGGKWEFDHSTQYFTATPGSKFEALVREWEAGGLVTRWPEPFVGRLSVGGPFVPFTDSIARFIGVGGFRPLCDYLADRSRVVRPQWVGEMKPVELGRWQLAKGPGGKPIGLYDFVAISHNGKCAARLAGTAKWSDGSGAADKVLSSLECTFGVRPLDQLQRQRRLVLSSIWALMFVVDGPELDGVEWEGAHITDSPTLAWASNVTAKRRHRPSGARQGAPGMRSAGKGTCWVLHSTPQFAKEHKVPQENIPPSKAEEVTHKMLRALEEALGLPPGAVNPSYTRAQLWGAANPLTVAGVPAVFDSESHTGACGDWCEGPPCVEAAAESALALSAAIEDLLIPSNASSPGAARHLNSLQVRWSAAPSAGSPLGAFPGMPGGSESLGSLPSPGDDPKDAASGRGRGGRGGRGRGGRGSRERQQEKPQEASKSPGGGTPPSSGRGGAPRGGKSGSLLSRPAQPQRRLASPATGGRGLRGPDLRGRVLPTPSGASSCHC